MLEWDATVNSYSPTRKKKLKKERYFKYFWGDVPLDSVLLKQSYLLVIGPNLEIYLLHLSQLKDFIYKGIGLKTVYFICF